jgi:two-component system, LytTR family, sensor kinase
MMNNFKISGITSVILLWFGIWLTFSLLLGWDGFQNGLIRAFPLVIGQMILVILNIYWLMPRYFLIKKYLLYTVAIIFFVFLITYIVTELSPFFVKIFGLETLERRGSRIRNDSIFEMIAFRIWRSFPFLIAVVISSLYKTAGLADAQQKEKTILQKEKLETEMKLLKSQINPHFLFNVLNNLYSLSLIKSDLTPDYLLKLSGMLRYILYECNVEKVLLTKEIEYIENYVEMFKLKDSRGLNIKLSLEQGPKNFMIAPMVFIPFIENSFKHSNVENLVDGWIRISLSFFDNMLHFSIANSKSEKSFTKDKQGGIGLKNVARQLQLIYPGTHKLEIAENSDSFVINLSIW